MTTLRKYLDVVKAEMDKSLLEAAGIPAFIAGENSASIGYGSILAEVHLQVQDADVDRARQVLQDNKEATPLSDDFIPTEPPPTETPRFEIADPDSNRAALSVIVTLVIVLVMLAAFSSWKTAHSGAAYFRRGYAKRATGDLNGALADFNKAIELGLRDGYTYYNRGAAYYDKRDWNDALSDFRKVATLTPPDSHSDILQDYSHIRIWMTRAKQGERNAATNELKQYLITRTIGHPGDWPSTIARLLTGDLSEHDFLKAVDTSDEKQTQDQRCQAYFYVGTVRLMDGDKSTAALYFRMCLENGGKSSYEYHSAAAELEALKK